MGFVTLARPAEHEEVVKGSRFLAVAHPLRHVEQLEASLDRRRSAMGDASHHAWALRWGDVMRWSDDGEPGGTAGRPVLEVVLKRGLDRAGVIVTRYFGGTKLGAGGLARAYSGAAARALDAAGVREVEERERWTVRLPYGAVDAVLRRAHEQPGAGRAEADYDALGALVVLELRSADAASWQRLLADLTRGEAELLERLELDT